MEALLLIAVLVTVVVGFFFLWQKMQKPKKDDQSLVLLQNQINELTRTLEGKMGESAKAMRDELGRSAQLIRDITQELTRVSEGQKQVMSVTDQLRNLQDILKNPKQRGVLGEYYLETVLKNVLPPGTFELQYEFKDGAKVDAVVKTKPGIIPVDSKFSLENYNRMLEAKTQEERERYENAFYNDLKIRIDETAKYIRPEEGTLEFAFMFIPSEAIYYDLLINKIGATRTDLIEYAAGQKKVMVVSPTTFLAYLQTVMQGLKALQIEETAKKIGERVRDLSRHLQSYESYHQKLGTHLGTTVNMFNKSSQEFKKIDKDILKITGEAAGVEPQLVEASVAEEE